MNSINTYEDFLQLTVNDLKTICNSELTHEERKRLCVFLKKSIKDNKNIVVEDNNKRLIDVIRGR